MCPGRWRFCLILRFISDSEVISVLWKVYTTVLNECCIHLYQTPIFSGFFLHSVRRVAVLVPGAATARAGGGSSSKSPNAFASRADASRGLHRLTRIEGRCNDQEDFEGRGKQDRGRHSCLSEFRSQRESEMRERKPQGNGQDASAALSRKRRVEAIRFDLVLRQRQME